MSNTTASPEAFARLEEYAKQIILAATNQQRTVAAVQNNNWVFLTNDLKRPLMVKFVPSEERSRLEAEVGVCRFLTEHTDIPVPSVIEYGEHRKKFFVLREVIPGKSLEWALANPAVDWETLLSQAGMYLAKLHNSGSFSQKGILQPDLSVEPYQIYCNQEYTSFFAPLREQGLLSEEECVQLSRIDADSHYRGENVLCHLDYSLSNLLVRDNQVVGIIDFEWAGACPPIDDLASFDLFLELSYPQYPNNAFYQGYQLLRELPTNYQQNLGFYKLYRLLTMLAYQVQASNQRFEGDYQQRMKDKFRELVEIEISRMR